MIIALLKVVNLPFKNITLYNAHTVAFLFVSVWMSAVPHFDLLAKNAPVKATAARSTQQPPVGTARMMHHHYHHHLLRIFAAAATAFSGVFATVTQQ